MKPFQHSAGAVRATSVPVLVVVLAHAAISSAIIQAARPDVPDLVVYWFISVLGPSLTWALLVLCRAAVWRRRSAFWLGASAGIVVLGAFLVALLIYITDISARGIPLALLYSSWVLLGCAIAVAVVLCALGKHVDAPVDAQLDGQPDAAGDASAEAQPDAEVDAQVEAQPGAAVDAQVEAPHDPAADARVDTQSDAQSGEATSRPERG